MSGRSSLGGWAFRRIYAYFLYLIGRYAFLRHFIASYGFLLYNAAFYIISLLFTHLTTSQLILWLFITFYMIIISMPRPYCLSTCPSSARPEMLNSMDGWRGIHYCLSSGRMAGVQRCKEGRPGCFASWAGCAITILFNALGWWNAKPARWQRVAGKISLFLAKYYP